MSFYPQKQWALSLPGKRLSEWSEEELLEQLTTPDVEYEDDGTVWVYWFDQKIDITDKFENDVCYVELVNDEQTLYMTVRYKNGYSTSPRKYVDVWRKAGKYRTPMIMEVSLGPDLCAAYPSTYYRKTNSAAWR